MKKHGYEIAGDKMNSNKASYMLTVIMGIVIAVGLVISLLSFFILILSIYLLLQKTQGSCRTCCCSATLRRKWRAHT